MSLQCQNCGAVQPSGKFCPNCGGQMVPIAPAPTAPPPMPMQQQHPAAAHMVPQPPVAAKRTPWGLIAAIGGGVLVVGILAVVFLLKDSTPPAPPPKTVTVDPPKTEPVKTEPTKPAGPAGPTKNLGGTTLKLLAQGSFGARPAALVSHGSYLAYGTDSVAAFYKFDAKGQAKELARLNVKSPVGKLLSVATGEIYNDGKVHMLALFEHKLYIIAEQGGVLKEIDVNGVDNVLIGDYDGDGKTETIYMGLDGAGAYGFEVWRYPDNSSAQYSKKGRKDPWPELFQTEMKAGTTSLLMGYKIENDQLFLLLYKWDGIGGPAVIGSYPIENRADAPPEWIASGPSGLGPTLAVGRGGAKPSVEIMTVSSDAKSAKSAGRFDSDGKGRSAVLTGKFTGQNSQILTIDEAGSYWLYDIGK